MFPAPVDAEGRGASEGFEVVRVDRRNGKPERVSGLELVGSREEIEAQLRHLSGHERRSTSSAVPV